MMCLSAGLYPGTEYQISVQAIKGNTEGKASSATGVTGQYKHINIQSRKPDMILDDHH